MGKHTGGRFGAAVMVPALMGMTLVASSVRAQTFTTLVNFSLTNGFSPQFESLVQGTDGNLYGTTVLGGNTSCDSPYGCGTAFKVTPTGALTTLYDFDSTHGIQPPGLVLGLDGNFYGTTPDGGVNNDGTVFRITPEGRLTTVYSFSFYVSGANPLAALALGSDGDFYGTTSNGGANGYGTIFRITSGGKLTTLHGFNSGDPTQIYSALAEGGNRSFYGTSELGGANYSDGTIFELAPDGTFTILHNFDGTDGADPNAVLVQAQDGNFYGTTSTGGANGSCYSGCGNIFKITPGGVLSTLYTFCSQTNCLDGFAPYSGLVQGTDGNFYGTTRDGGAYGYGTIFKITPQGTLTTLHSLDSTDGAIPAGALVQDTNGDFYGTTAGGGTDDSCSGGCGTIFALSVGLGPFVETVPTTGNVGTAIKILGTNLKGATNVTFNGTSATFKVISGSLISTTVPAGAITGPVQVVTPSRTLTSNVNFQVLP